MDEMSLTKLAVVEQLPIITEHLADAREVIQARVAEAKALVATEETLTTVKAYRADTTKEFNQLEDLRKQVKAAVMAPYEAFEAVYRECVSLPYREADKALKDRIGAVEAEIIGRCQDACRAYFDEACAVRGIDFVKFENVAPRIGLTEAKQKTQPPKKVREHFDTLLDRVQSDVGAIGQMEDAAEVMAEYVQCLDMGRSVAAVKSRHAAIEEARKAQELSAQRAQEEALRRAQVSQDTPIPERPIFAPPVPIEHEASEKVEPDPEQLLRVRFTVVAPRKLIKELKVFMEERGIAYE